MVKKIIVGSLLVLLPLSFAGCTVEFTSKPTSVESTKAPEKQEKAPEKTKEPIAPKTTQSAKFLTVDDIITTFEAFGAVCDWDIQDQGSDGQVATCDEYQAVITAHTQSGFGKYFADNINGVDEELIGWHYVYGDNWVVMTAILSDAVAIKDVLGGTIGVIS